MRTIIIRTEDTVTPETLVETLKQTVGIKSVTLIPYGVKAILSMK